MRHRWLLGLSIAIVVVIAGGVFFLLHAKSRSPFSTQIDNQANFIIFYPDQKTSGYQVVTSTIKYDNSAKVLSFVAKGSNDSLTITEQATPDPFNDISQYWDAFTTKLQAYTSFDSVNGQVALTHPIELKGGQSAIQNAKGTLMFVHPSANGLSDNQWRLFFDSLQMQN